MADNLLSNDITLINGEVSSSIKKNGEYFDELNNRTVVDGITLGDEWTNKNISTDGNTIIEKVTIGDIYNAQDNFIIKEGETEARSKYIFDESKGTLTFKDETLAKKNEFGCTYDKSDEVPLHDMVRDLEILSAFNRIPDFGSIYDFQVRQLTFGVYKYANALLCVNLAKSLGYMSMDKIINDEYTTKKGMNDLYEKYKNDTALTDKFPAYSGWLDSEEYINNGWVDIDELIKKSLKEEFAYDDDWSLSVRTRKFQDRKRALVQLILTYTSNVWGLNSANKIVDFGIRVVDKTSGKQLDYTDIKNGLRDAVGQTITAQFVGELGTASITEDGTLTSGQESADAECAKNSCDKSFVNKCDGTIFKKDCLSDSTNLGSEEDRSNGNFHFLSPQFKLNPLSNFRKDKPDILNTIDPINWTTGNISEIKRQFPEAYNWIDDLNKKFGESAYESTPLNQNRAFHYVGGTFDDGIAAGGFFHQNDITLNKEFWGSSNTYEIWNGTAWRYVGTTPLSRGLGLGGGDSSYHVEAWGVQPLWNETEGDVNNDKVSPYGFRTNGISNFYEFNNGSWAVVSIDPIIEKHSVSGIITASKTGSDAAAIKNENFTKTQLSNNECIEACTTSIQAFQTFLGSNSANDISYKNVFSGFCFNGTRGPSVLDGRNYCDDFDDTFIFFSHIYAVKPNTAPLTTNCSFVDQTKKYPVKTIGTCYVGTGTTGIATGGKTCMSISSCDGVDARSNKYKRYFDSESYHEEYDSIVKYAYEWNGTAWSRREDMPEDVAFHCGVGDAKWSVYWGGLHSSIERANVTVFVPGCDTWYQVIEAFNGATNKYGICGLGGEIKYAEFANTFLQVTETGTNVYRVPVWGKSSTSKYYPVIEVAASCSSKFEIDISVGVNNALDECPAAALSLLGARNDWGVKSRYIGSVENEVISATISIKKTGGETPASSGDPGIGVYLGMYDLSTGKYVLASSFEWNSKLWIDNFNGDIAEVNINPTTNDFIINPLVNSVYNYGYFGEKTCSEFNISSTFPTLNSGDPGYPAPGILYPASIVVGPYSYDSEVKSGKCDGSLSMNADDQFVLDSVNGAASYSTGTVLKNLAAGNTFTIEVRNIYDTSTGASGYVHALSDFVNTSLDIYQEIADTSAALITGNYTIYEYNDYGGFYAPLGHRGHYKQTTVPISGDRMYISWYEGGTTVLTNPISGSVDCVCTVCLSGSEISGSEISGSGTIPYDSESLASAVNTEWVGYTRIVDSEIYNYRHTNLCDMILNNYNKNSPSEGGTLLSSESDTSNKWIWSVPVKIFGDEEADSFFIKRSSVVSPSEEGCEVVRSVTRNAKVIVSRAIVAGPDSTGIGMYGFGKCNMVESGMSGAPFDGFFDYQELDTPMSYDDAKMVFPWVIIGDEGTVGPRGCVDMFDNSGNYWFAVGDANNKKSSEISNTQEQINSYTIIMVTPDKFEDFNNLIVARTNLKLASKSIQGFEVSKTFIEQDAVTGMWSVNKTARNREGLLEAINVFDGNDIFKVYIKLFEYIVPDISQEDNTFILDSVNTVTSGGVYSLPYFDSSSDSIDRVENYNITTSKDISCLNCYTCENDEDIKYVGKNWIQHYHEEWAAPYIQHPLAGIFSRPGFNAWITAGDCPQRWGTAVWTTVDNGRVWLHYKKTNIFVNESRNHLVYAIMTSSVTLDNYAETASKDNPVINKYDEFIFNLSDYADDTFIMSLVNDENLDKHKICEEQTAVFVPDTIWSTCLRDCQEVVTFTSPSCSANCADTYTDIFTGCSTGSVYASEDFDPDVGYTEWASSFVMEYKRSVNPGEAGDEKYYYKYDVDELGSNCLKDREGINDQPIIGTSWRRYQDGVGLGGDAPLFNRVGVNFACNNTMVNFIGQKAFGTPDKAIICGGYAIESNGELAFNHHFWNNFTQGPTFKWNRFVINPEDTVNRNYTYRNLSPFFSNGDQTLTDSVHGSIIFDVSGPATVERYGQILFNDTNEAAVEFEAFPEFITNRDKYSISLTPSDNVRVWWENKADGGFTVKCELAKWTGSVDWKITYIEEISADRIDGVDSQTTFDGYEDK